jgi:hypothetical protein
MKSGGKNVRSTDKRKIEELIILNEMKFIPEEIKKGNAMESWTTFGRVKNKLCWD